MTKNKADLFDLATLDTRAACDEPFCLDVKHPVSKVSTGIKIWLVGVDSQAITTYVDERTNRRIRQSAAIAKRGEEPELPTVEKQLADNIEFWTVAIISSNKPWENMVYKGSELPFTADNVKKMLEEFKWLRGQVDIAIGTLENFMKA